MKRISLDQARTGMILSEDIKSLDGRLLAPSGMALTDGLLESLARLGVEAVIVQESVTDIPVRVVELAVEYVSTFFMYVNHSDPLLGTLFDICSLRTARRLAEGWSPPSDDSLAGNVDHLFDLFFRDEGQPTDVVSAEIEVASFPDVYFNIRKALESETASADDIAQIVMKDVALSAKLLKLVNSPFYGFSRTIDTIPRAVTLVGGKELSTMALGITAISVFKDIPPELIDMQTFWRHSISVGLLAKVLATRAGENEPERYFTSGLLHDVGRLILFKQLPQASVDALRYARGACVPLVDAEEEVFGYDHTSVADLLLTQWQFPESLVSAVRHHHNPGASSASLSASIICVADVIANSLAIPRGSLFALPGLMPGTWESLGIPVEDVEDICREHDMQLEAILGAFFG